MDTRIASGDAVSRSGFQQHEVPAIRLGGWAAVVGGVLMVGHQVADLIIGGRTTDAPRALLHTAWLVALFLAVRGIGVLQRRRPDRVGNWLVRVALVGVGVAIVAASVEAAALLVDPNPSGDPSPPMLVAFIAALFALVVGLLAFAVAIIRGGVLPRSVGLAVLAGVLIKMFAPEPVPSLAIFGLTIVWLGIEILRRSGFGPLIGDGCPACWPVCGRGTWAVGSCWPPGWPSWSARGARCSRPMVGASRRGSRTGSTNRRWSRCSSCCR